MTGFLGANPAPMKDSEKEIAAANHPKIRLLVQKKLTSATPLTEASDTWTECTPETAETFPQSLTFSGENLGTGKCTRRADRLHLGWHTGAFLDKPRGLGAANLTSVLRTVALLPRTRAMRTRSRPSMRVKTRRMQAAGKPVVAHPRMPNDHGDAWIPGTLFNAMIAPYTRFAIKGVLWYQGETDSDAKRAPYYSSCVSPR